MQRLAQSLCKDKQTNKQAVWLSYVYQGSNSNTVYPQCQTAEQMLLAEAAMPTRRKTSFLAQIKTND